jgi:hypothetical protein
MSRHRSASAQRQGTILIVVSAICALLASLSLAFLVKIRASSEVTALVVQETQARLMLHAACCYILEASRLGYGPSRADALHPPIVGKGMVSGPSGDLQVREGYGWIDVRSADLGLQGAGSGPFDQNLQPVAPASSSCWPAVGGIVICPMFRWQRPPYAIRATVAYNPILIDPARSGEPAYGRPLLSNPDPQPAVVNGWPGAVSDALITPLGLPAWNDFVNGLAQPFVGSQGSSWFRVWRKSAATFIVTCGAGGTMGYRDWQEVLSTPAAVAGAPAGGPNGAALFNNDPSFFAALLAAEVRTWYEVRWSAGVRPLDFRFEEPKWWFHLQNGVAYRTYPVNATQYPGWCRANKFNANPVGTISYIQRLEGRGGAPVDPATGVLPSW